MPLSFAPSKSKPVTTASAPPTFISSTSIVKTKVFPDVKPEKSKSSVMPPLTTDTSVIWTPAEVVCVPFVATTWNGL